MKNIFHFFLVLLILIIASTSFAQVNNFSLSGVGGGSALFHPSISPHDEQIIYVASDVSGMFYTNDGGDNWEIIPSKDLVATTESKVNFTSDPNILYTVCRDFILDKDHACKSVDAGITWTRIEHPELDGEVEYLFADPNHTDRIIITTYDEMFYSADGGMSINIEYEAETDAGLYLAGVFWDQSNIYVGSTDGLLISTDAGLNFSKETVEGLPNDFGFLSFAGAKEGDSLRFFSVARNKYSFYPGIWGSDYWEEESAFFCLESDGNNGFATLDGFDFTLSNFPFFTASSASDINTVYVAGAKTENAIHPSVWKSTDGGMNWDSVLETENNANIETGYMGEGGVFDWQWSENAMGLAVSPTDPNMSIISDFSFLHITKDGGENWKAAYVKPEERNSAGSSIPIAKTYSSNGLENTSVWGLHWSSPDKIFACFTDLTGFYSIDGGTQWSLDYTGLDYFDENDFTQKRFNTIYHISEHPQNDLIYASASTLHDIYQTHVLTDSELAGENQDTILGAIWSSNNGGEDWSLIHEFDMPILQTVIDPNNQNIMYATAPNPYSGGFFKTNNLSDDTAATWELLPSPDNTAGRANSIDVLNDGNLVCTYSGGQTNGDIFTSTSGVFYSEDGGQTWEDKSAPEMKYYTKGFTIDPHDVNQNTWYVGVFDGWPIWHPSVDLGGLYRTTNRGDSWEELGDFYRVESVTIHPENPEIMYVATESEGLWFTSNLTATNPNFQLIEEYPFLHPVRTIFNPFDVEEIWITSFGNGIRKGPGLNVSNNPSLITKVFVSTSPNPGNDFINFRLESDVLFQNRELSLSIFDLSGKLILETPFSNLGYQLKKSQTGAGSFIYQISTKSKRLAVGKIMFFE
ncbi:MAG: WD40/YVTN/BNR-like repeat-containing protein [Saprospiraceae bacterium]